MTVLVLDASVVVKWFVEEVHAAEARLLLDASTPYAAPDLIFAEVANTIRKKVRRGDLSNEAAEEIVKDLTLIDINTVPCHDLTREAHALAAATDRSVYDAMYLALAIRLDTRLITADQRFANAIRSRPLLAAHIQFLADTP
jgi:predicted nucleic acid-binding protein